MLYIILSVAVILGAVLLFAAADYWIKTHKTPQSVDGYLWNAAYFLSIRRYQTALDRLAEMEKRLALTPEQMCDASFKRADAYLGLNQPERAIDAYEQAYRCLAETDRPLKQNDALLAEIKACYQSCERGEAFTKWEMLIKKTVSAETH